MIGHVTMRPAVRRPVDFKLLNLMNFWPMRGPFDIIFCRNVMIYFDDPTKAKLLDRFASILRPVGLLYVGYSETLAKATKRLELVGRTIYRKAN